MIIETGKTYIRKVQATSVGATANVIRRDPLALQLRLGSTLSLADVQPRGVPASAIICVRSIRAPRLPAQYTRSGGERPPLWWEERVRALITQAIQQVAHPLEDNVPVDADAVIFADRAELLACLASDWCAGNGGRHWWWQSLFRSGDLDQLLLPAWLETPEYIPAALHYLAARYKAVSFVQRLPSRDIHTLLESLTRSFALHQLQPVLASPFPSGRTARPPWQKTTEQELNAASPLEDFGQAIEQALNAASPLRECGRTPTPAQLSYETARQHMSRRKPFSLPPEIPWRSWVPESMESGLSLEQQALLGIGLMLIRAFSSVQTPSFARAVHRWLNGINVDTVESEEAGTGRQDWRDYWHPPHTSKGDVSQDVSQREGRQPQDAWLGNILESGEASRDESYDAALPVQTVLKGGSPGDSERKGPGQWQEIALANEREDESLSARSQISDTPSPLPPAGPSLEYTPEIDDSPVHDTIVSRSPVDKRVNKDARGAQWQNRRTRRAYYRGSDGSRDDEKGVGAAQPFESFSGEVKGVGATQSFESSPDDEKGVDAAQSFEPGPGEEHDAGERAQSAPAESISLRGREDRPLQVFLSSSPASGTPGEVEVGRAFQDARVETEFGGIFYLINLGLFLNLYGDFTTPLRPGLALSMWDFVALLGLQMVGKDLLADPVWPLLASLSGRHGEEHPGYAFEPPELWRVPETWLRAFPMQDDGESWCWSMEDGRLRVLHPAQFLLLDVPLDTSGSLAQLRREMRRYSDLPGTRSLQPGEEPLFPDDKLLPCGRAVVTPFDGSIPPSLLRWLGWLMPYIYARLQRALGLAEGQDPARMLCWHSASISVTATHVDIFLALQHLPIDIRIAGLDRNPGWVPAAGRFIAFHFQ